MGWIWNKHNMIANDAIDKLEKPMYVVEKPVYVADWQWVDGFKCTNLKMKCKNDFTYELNKQYDIDNGEPIKTCTNGFHFCKEISHLFVYKNLANSRFFKCRGLVDINSNDYKTYGVTQQTDHTNYAYGRVVFNTRETEFKLVAKSIILTEEINIKDTYKDYIFYQNKMISEYGLQKESFSINNCTDYLLYYKYKDMDLVYKYNFTKAMIALGYTEAFSTLFTFDNRTMLQEMVSFVAMLHGEGVSKDMSVYLILEKYKELKQ